MEFFAAKTGFLFMKIFISVLYISKKCKKKRIDNASRIWILVHEFVLQRVPKETFYTERVDVIHNFSFRSFDEPDWM